MVWGGKIDEELIGWTGVPSRLALNPGVTVKHWSLAIVSAQIYLSGWTRLCHEWFWCGASHWVPLQCDPTSLQEHSAIRDALHGAVLWRSWALPERTTRSTTWPPKARMENISNGLHPHLPVHWLHKPGSSPASSRCWNGWRQEASNRRELFASSLVASVWRGEWRSP